MLSDISSLALRWAHCSWPTTDPGKLCALLRLFFPFWREKVLVLMCRGKAVKDFKGPDCRFVDFKEGESVYVYFKLTGRTNDLWAGSVGNEFGYFPKDLLEVKHIYTHDELELPTDETDFVCIDGGKDDFDNYNADELLKGTENMVTNRAEADFGTEKEEEIEGAEPTDSTDPESEEFGEGSEEENEDHAKMDKKDNFIFEKHENVEGALESKSEDLVNSDTDYPQGDQISHQPSEEILPETLKVPKHENTKNSSVSQGEAKQSDYGGKDDGAYTLLPQEVSEDLKTKFGSTADAFVSDDETTSLVTSLDGDFREDTETDSYDTEKLEDAKERSVEIPLLAFTKEEMESSKDLEAENISSDGAFQSETGGFDEEEGVAKFTHEEKDDSDLFTHLGDKLYAIVSGGEQTVDEIDRDTVEEEEEEEDLTLISQKESEEDVSDYSESASEDEPVTSEHDFTAKKMHDADSEDPKGGKYNNQDYEEEHAQTEEQLTAKEELQSSSAFSSYRDSLQPKTPMGTKEETLKPPQNDIKDDPEELSFHPIKQNKESREEKNVEDALENDTKYTTLWEKIGKKDGEDKQPMDMVSNLLEELANESQNDLDDADLLGGKTKQDGEDFELKKRLVIKKQSNDSEMENIPTKKDNEMPIEQSQEETSIQDFKEEKIEDEDKDFTNSKKQQKKSFLEKSGSATQHRNLTQQSIFNNEAEQLGKFTGIDKDRKKLSTEELQPTEKETREDYFLEEPEELLQDENAMSAKLSKEKFTDEPGFILDVEHVHPPLQIPNGAISRAANPVDETEDEALKTLEEVKEKDGVVNLNEEYERMQKNKDSPLKEEEKNKEVEPTVFHEVQNPLLKEKNQIKNIHDKIISSNLNIFELEDKDDFNQTKEHLANDFSQKGLKDLQMPTGETEGKHQNSHDSKGISENTNEAVEPEYSASVRKLIIMKEFLDERRIARLEKHLGQQQVYRIESLFQDMELELLFAQKHNDNHEDIEKALDLILESSESNILDVLNRALESREIENKEEVIKEMDLFDEEGAIMDDVQELMYSLRQKYSPVSESAPLASLTVPEIAFSEPITTNAKQTEHDRHTVENPAESTDRLHNVEQMSKKEILQPEQRKKDENILAEIETLDKTEIGDIVENDQRMPNVDTALGSEDSSTERDFMAGLIVAKDNTMEEGSIPSEMDAVSSRILASLDGAVLSAKKNMRPFTEILVSTLPEDMRPGPDFHGLPWEPIVITVLVGIATLLIFFWRTCLSVKSRMYQVTEKQLVEKIKTLLKEKTEILEKMSKYDQKIKEAKESVEETQKQNTTLSDEATGLKDTIRGLEETNHLLDDRVKNLNTMLEMERDHNVKKQEQITEAQKSLEKLQEVIALHSVELSEVQIALNETKLNEEKVKSELHRMQEENARLKKSKEQLLKEAEGWSERHAELSEQITLYQKSQKDIEEALAYKDNEIEVLTNCIMQLKQLDADSESEGKRDEGNDLANGEISDTRNEKMKKQIKQMMDVSRVKTTLSIIEEERDNLRSKLNDEVAARHELEEQIKKLEHETSSLQTAKSQLEGECKTLQQKVEILNELYQQKEMALQKKLTQEEYERQEKEQKLSAADEKALLAVEEVKLYKQRIQEMDEELQKTERSYKNQIAAHEKKAHDNWLIARSAERALIEEKREAANLRQKLIEVNQKIDAIQRPVIVKPTAGRPDHQVPPRRGPLSRDGSFGPSPVSGGVPSPPLMMEPPGRPLSANPREGSRDAAPVEGPPVPRRHPELSGRMSAPDLGPAVAALLNCGPRTSSPSTVPDGMQSPPKEHEAPSVSAVPTSAAEATAVNISSKGPPSFPGAPMMSSPASGPLPPPVRFGPPPRAPYGPRPLPLSLVRGAPPPPIPRDYPPGPPFGIRDFPPGPRLPPPEQRGYLRGPPPFRPPPPRDFPPGPRLPPQGLRDYPPLPVRDLPPSGASDYQGGPPCPPSPASSRDSTHHPEQKP
ncbi:transport and Golgi organization protein 1 homolog isoform X2 [Varanus komodoensis]|uniref:transport and Golgi organization protein 1 homolog isoform X2 n=1 Tax=Varanus komodoensis TaxID=61221 RepID=UPI001CF77A32|nr:transport and Golgi organization protein 1 homolog isoform X2 [Varanus komodoensis]